MMHLRGRQADVVIDISQGVPVIAYWGAPLGEVDPGSVAAALERLRQFDWKGGRWRLILTL